MVELLVAWYKVREEWTGRVLERTNLSALYDSTQEEPLSPLMRTGAGGAGLERVDKVAAE